MAKTFRLEVITPERVVLDVEVESVILPGVDGYFGLLANHAPIVAALRTGPATLRIGDRREKVAVASGVFEFSGNHGVVLADAAERADEIDVLRARAALERARTRLMDRQGNWDHARARAALERALTRLRVAGAHE